MGVNMKKYQIYMEEILEKKMKESKASSIKVREYLKQSSVAFKGRCVQTLQFPKIYTQKEIKKFQQIVKTTYGIFEKIIRHYKEEEEYRKEFPFSKELEELICAPTGYETDIPITRIDIFYNEEKETFQFCEFNTDGSSAMIEDLELQYALQYNNIYKELQKTVRLDSFELFDTWVQTVESIYKTYKKKVDTPHIAIVDFLDKAYLPEFREFLRRFNKYGFTAEICDIRELQYQDSTLISNETGKNIDIMYRRAVTCDIMEQQQSVQPFLQAVKNQDVCLVGSFQTQIAHHKSLFYLLHQEKTLSILSSEEQDFIKKHVPKTYLLDTYTKPDIYENKNSWIIKPIDSYASKGVYAGVDYKKEEWKKLIEANQTKDYILQEYCAPYKTKNIDLTVQESIIKEYNNLTGLYVYGGKFAGIYSRHSDGGIISSQYNEKTVATLFAQEM